MSKIFDRRFIRLLGAISVALLIALALVPALQAGACTDPTPYPYGDANMDGVVNVADTVRVSNIVVGGQEAQTRYVNVSDFAQGGAGGVNLAAYKQAAVLPAGKWTGGDPYWTNFSDPGDYDDTAACPPTMMLATRTTSSTSTTSSVLASP